MIKNKKSKRKIKRKRNRKSKRNYTKTYLQSGGNPALLTTAGRYAGIGAKGLLKGTIKGVKGVGSLGKSTLSGVGSGIQSSGNGIKHTSIGLNDIIMSCADKPCRICINELIKDLIFDKNNDLDISKDFIKIENTINDCVFNDNCTKLNNENCNNCIDNIKKNYQKAQYRFIISNDDLEIPLQSYIQERTQTQLEKIQLEKEKNELSTKEKDEKKLINKKELLEKKLKNKFKKENFNNKKIFQMKNNSYESKNRFIEKFKTKKKIQNKEKKSKTKKKNQKQRKK